MIAGQGRGELLCVARIDAHRRPSEITFMLVLIARSLLLLWLRAYARIVLLIRRVYHLQLLHLMVLRDRQILVQEDSVSVGSDVSAVLIMAAVLMDFRTGWREDKVLRVLVVLRNIPLALRLVYEVIYDSIVVLRCL